MATSIHNHRFTAAADGEPAITEAVSGFDWEPLLTIAVTVAGTLAITLVSAWLAWRTARQTERRKLYAEATKAAVAWGELLYRVRRRSSNDKEFVQPLVERFHQAQEDITFHEAWIGSESAEMAQSYRALIRGVKRKTEPLITAAWEDGIRDLPGNAKEGDAHPNVSELTEAFLGDIRSHLSVNPFKKAPSAKELAKRTKPQLKEGGN